MKPLKSILTLLTILIFIQICHGQTIEKIYSAGSKSVGFRDMYECTNGDFIAGCDFYDTTTYSVQAGLMRLSSTGNVLWAKALSSSNVTGSCSFEVVEANNGNYYLNGLIQDGSNLEMSALISCFDSQGNINWSKSYPIGISGTYSINQMKLLNNDDLLSLVTVGDKVLIIKTDSVGNIIFGKTITTDTLGGGKNPGFDVIELMDGSYLATSKIEDDLMIVKMDSIGQTLWTKTYQVGGYIQAHSLIENSLNQIFITGDLCDTSSNQYCRQFIMEINQSNGNIDYIKTFDYIDLDDVAYYYNDISINNNSLIITFLGVDYSNTFGERIYTIYLDFNGNVINSYISKENFPTPYSYYKSFNTVTNEIIIYGSIYEASSFFENGTFIKSQYLDSSCVFEYINMSTLPFNDYNVITNQYFENIYTYDSIRNINTTSVTINESDLCTALSVFELNQTNVEINIYPNPANDKFTVNDIEQEYAISIYNSIGERLYNEEAINSNYKSFDISNYSSGILLIQITSNNKTYSYKLIKL